MQKLVEVIAKSLVDYPDEVRVKEVVDGDSIVFELSVAQSDMGKIIGKQGKTVKALRTVVNAAAVKDNKKISVEII
ncbi:hypothetical protein BHU72_03125 [Desulfuribacillus stibiiarsenatis]|uniref:RNA-binding protein KhpA n=1 Tax=Desulfuribacillus stibiiarsenatis TaxID=1390249 RepID=A0A1E5L728_9FIRM|nr:KH domain-containing protein [Desulfuribacillus stibiiarsenatis]OEH85789.1 hypothetical protein BHU72_03125 [Desulfuribacillus stibiiarsenatis]